MASTLSKAAAARFLSDHVGHVIDTTQVRPGGNPWKPGPRTLTRRGLLAFALDGSTVEFSRTHFVTALTDTSLTVEWRDGDGRVIHTTTYTVAA